MYMATKLDLSECRDCTCFAVRRAARAITQVYDRALRPAGLRATQFTLLVVVALGRRLTVGQLADQMGMDRTTLTRNLSPLVERGLVAIHGTQDGRVREVALTPAGTAAVAAALPRWRKAQRAMAGRLTPATRRSLAALADPVSAGA